MEIERKFTLKKLPENLEQYECRMIEQGYLSTKPIIRIRRLDDEYILTYKSKDGIAPTDQDVIISKEVELPLNEESYNHLKEKVDGYLITKKRYIIPIENGLKIELDIFENQLEGLQFAEIEFPSVEAANEFQLLEWFDQDVSKDERYKNSNLCTLERW